MVIQTVTFNNFFFIYQLHDFNSKNKSLTIQLVTLGEFFYFFILELVTRKQKNKR